MPKYPTTDEYSSPVPKIIITVAIAIFVLSLLFGSFYIVRAGERAVLLTFGNPSQVAIAEGLHMKIPFVQKAVIMDVKTLKYTADASAASKDLQDVKTTVAINYHLVADLTPQIYQTIGLAYAETVIQPAEQEAIKAVTAQFTAEELITKREFVREQIIELLKEKLNTRGIIVEEISIVNFEFSPVFTTSIEAKVVAEQNALAAKNKLEQVKYEKEMTITRAQGEAEAIKIQAEAIKAQGGEAYVQLQAVNKWNGIMPQVTGGAIPFINMQMNTGAAQATTSA